VAQMVETLSSNPRTEEKKKKKFPKFTCQKFKKEQNKINQAQIKNLKA
jgi:hypothetical protein